MNFPLKLKCQPNFTFNPTNLSTAQGTSAKLATSTSYNHQNIAKSISVAQTSTATTTTYNVEFNTLGGCTLGIARYPNFVYNAQGGAGRGIATPTDSEDEVSACFDPRELYIPSLSAATTTFLGLPLPPFLKIEIVPELFRGRVNAKSGKVDLEFKANFLFSVGSIYRAPPLEVATVLTSEESKGGIRSGSGERLDKEGRCRLVGVATVAPIDDFFMNTFLQLPTECIAELNALISFSDQS